MGLKYAIRAVRSVNGLVILPFRFRGGKMNEVYASLHGVQFTSGDARQPCQGT